MKVLSNAKQKTLLLALVALLVVSGAFGLYRYLHERSVKAAFVNLLFPVEDLATGKQGYMDSDGNIAIAPVYDYAYEFEDEWNGLTQAGYMYGWTNGLVDRKGNVVFPFQKIWAYYPASQTVCVARPYESKYRGDDEWRYGLFKLDGTMILPFEYKYLSEFVDGKALAQKNDYRWYILDEAGKELKQLDEGIKFAYVSLYRSGYIPFTRQGDGISVLNSLGEWSFTYWGYMDRDGNVLFELKDMVTYATRFYNGRAVITDWNRNGYRALIINTSGDVLKVLENSYFRFSFSDGITCGHIFDEQDFHHYLYGAIDTDGNWVVPPKYQKTDCFDGVITAKMADNYYEFYDKRGNLLMAYGNPCTYFKDGYFFTLKNDHIYMMDINGNTIMQVPEGYMPRRCEHSSPAWTDWQKQHVSAVQ